jgi:hypothetical protein
MGREVDCHTVQVAANDLMLCTKSIRRIVHSKFFEQLFANSTPEEKEGVLELIKKSRRDDLLMWMNNHSSILPCEMTARQLKTRARALGVPYYGNMVKSELIAAIQGDEDGKKDRQIPAHHDQTTQTN